MEQFPAIEDLDPRDIVISKVKTRSYSLTSRKTGKRRAGSDKFVNVLNRHDKLGFSIANVETVGRYEPLNSMAGTIHIRISVKHSRLIRSRIVKPLANMIWVKRYELFTPDIWNEVSTLDELTTAVEDAMGNWVRLLLININPCDALTNIANRRLSKVELQIDRIMFGRDIRVVLQGHQFDLPVLPADSDESSYYPSEGSDEEDMSNGSPSGSPDVSEDEDEAQDHAKEPDSPDERVNSIVNAEPDKKKRKAPIQFTKLESRQNGLTVFWHILGVATFLMLLIWWSK